MTTTNSHRFTRARQSALGTPVTSGFRRGWCSNHGVKPEDTFEQPTTITGDTLIGKPMRTKSRAAGPVVGEFAFKQIDWMFELAFLNSYALTPEADGANIVSFTNATDTIVVDNDITFTVGDLVKIVDPDNPANTGEFVAIAGSGLNTLVIGAGGTLTDNSSVSASARIKVIGVQGASGDITATANGLGSTTMNWGARTWIHPGMQCKIGGPSDGSASFRFSAAADNRFATVVSKSSTALGLIDKGGSWATNDGSGKTIRVYFGDFLNRGTRATMPFETHETTYTDMESPSFIRYTDLSCNQFTQNLARTSRIEATANLIGLTDNYAGTEIDSPDEDAFIPPMLTGDNIGEILINNAVRASHSVVNSLNYDLNNNLQTDGPLNSRVDTVFAPGDAILRCGVTADFGSDIDWALFRGGTPIGMLLPFYDGLGRGYCRKLWAGVYVDGDATPGGRNQFAKFKGTIQGYKDPTYGFMETMTRFEGVGI